MKKIAVYCGASTGHNPIYKRAATQLADWLVSHNVELVYGGGGVGLMGVISKRMLSRGGKVHGVMPKELVERAPNWSNWPGFQILPLLKTCLPGKKK